ncbi:MAG: GNAT family N-acetyltransferase [Anaerolineae bacterium]|nr:GNAT family N-acetyltransferase [Anaerolineae bacterium]MDX9831990.1 GNAT family N-acetyltransferase [Anaerolineae bacterium]
MPDIRILRPGDEPILEAFLRPRVESSMFLLGNMRAAGLRDQGRPIEGTYAAAFEDHEIVAAAASYWNGNLVLQAPIHLPEVVEAVTSAAGRRVQGLIGPAEQVGAAWQVLGIDPRTVQWDEEEKLYTLALADLVVPAALAEGRVNARRMEPRDLELMTAWRVSMRVESMHEEDTPRLRQNTRETVERGLNRGEIWLLEEDGRPVSTTAFNASLAEAVQVGGVWTPPELRSRGYARAAVAASLLDARSWGVEWAVLFTGRENWPAQKAYESLGFRHVGDYRLVLLRPAR